MKLNKEVNENVEFIFLLLFSNFSFIRKNVKISRCTAPNFLKNHIHFIVRGLHDHGFIQSFIRETQTALDQKDEFSSLAKPRVGVTKPVRGEGRTLSNLQGSMPDNLSLRWQLSSNF